MAAVKGKCEDEGMSDGMDRQDELIMQGGQFKKLLEEQSMELRQKYGMTKAELEIL